MKFCPFLSMSSNQLEVCKTDCALYADNNECALKNLGNLKVEKSDEDDED